jgi:2-keto-4-pentenoate hydratase/2-oxohepta-3-ene-1,7-dioic acid hydratase in catechol pathway
MEDFMRLVTYQDGAGVHVGALRGDAVVALDSVAPDMLALIDQGAAGLAAAQAVLASAEVPAAGRCHPACADPAPAAERGLRGPELRRPRHRVGPARGREPKLPTRPVFFTKAVTAVAGPHSDFLLDPAVTEQLDYEAELAFVIGRSGKNIARSAALNYVFGYTVANDISARDLQSGHQQFFKGKSLDGSCPLGPCIVTADEIPDPGALTIRLTLNGELRQHSSTGDLIFDIPTLIEYLSLGMTLEAGTIVATGTPSGVGLGYTPPRFVQPGDVIVTAIDQMCDGGRLATTRGHRRAEGAKTRRVFIVRCAPQRHGH